MCYLQYEICYYIIELFKYLTMKKNLQFENPPTTLSENEINSFMKITPKYTSDDYEGTGKLIDKSIVVTASDNGVGKAVSIAFAKEGADIIMVYNHLKHEKEVKKTVKIIEKLGRKVWLFKSCTVDEFKCKKLFESILKKVSKIDILVNTFSISNKKDSDSGHYLLRKNDTLKIQSLFTLGRLAPDYLTPNGIIINSATLCAYAQPDQLIFYSALKAAIKTYTQEMNRMLSLTKNSLRINGITTGFIWSDTLPDELPNYENLPTNINSVTPMHPYEVAPLYVFIASKESKSIAGETLDAGGKIYKY